MACMHCKIFLKVIYNTYIRSIFIFINYEDLVKIFKKSRLMKILSTITINIFFLIFVSSTVF